MIRSLLRLNPNDRPNVTELLENAIVQKNYPGNLMESEKIHKPDDLLKTIIYDPKNLPSLKNRLPKPKYEVRPEKEAEADKKEESSDDKLKKFMEKRRENEEKARLKQVADLEQEKEELMKKRERVLSACGVRKNSICKF